jgi:phosphate:Na+ symporter
MAIGFVGAGLISFSEALGVTLGTSIGTTATGWIVALFGFKFKLGTLVLPVILTGVLFRLFASNRNAALGMVMAGFGLIFVGIDFMQTGIGSLSNFIRPEYLPGDQFTGRVILVLAGAAMTVLTQSSSAGVAATLVTLNAGAINFPQAAALVIGMNIGTTITAILATIGGSIGSKRTGFSHVIYNIFASSIAFFLITPYILLVQAITDGHLQEHSEIALVTFHTAFNTLGIIIVLPFIKQYSHLITRLFPDKSDSYISDLDPGILKEPDIAIAATGRSIDTILHALLGVVTALLHNRSEPDKELLTQLKVSIYEVQNYLDHIHFSPEQGAGWVKLLALINSVDHIQRLHERCDIEAYQALVLHNNPMLDPVRIDAENSVTSVIHFMEKGEWEHAADRAQQVYDWFNVQDEDLRHAVMMEVAKGNLSAKEGTVYLEGIRWMHRILMHIARICFHMKAMGG